MGSLVISLSSLGGHFPSALHHTLACSRPILHISTGSLKEGWDQLRAYGEVGGWTISKGRWVGRGDPKPRAERVSQAHSRPIHVIIQLLEGSGCQLLLLLGLGGSLLLCGRTSSVTLCPARWLPPLCDLPSPITGYLPGSTLGTGALSQATVEDRLGVEARQ